MIIQSPPITLILLDKSQMFSIRPHVPDITGVHKLLTKTEHKQHLGHHAIMLGNA